MSKITEILEHEYDARVVEDEGDVYFDHEKAEQAIYDYIESLAKAPKPKLKPRGSTYGATEFLWYADQYYFKGFTDYEDQLVETIHNEREGK